MTHLEGESLVFHKSLFINVYLRSSAVHFPLKLKRFEKLQPPETGVQEQPPELVPVPDEVMDRPATADRNIVLTRFTPGLSLRQIGDAMGKSESGAQRHLHREAHAFRHASL